MNSNTLDSDQDSKKASPKATIQLIWGLALVLAGVGVFFRTSEVMPRVAEIEYFTSVLAYIRFCFYLLGFLLIGGGSQKIYKHYKKR